MSGTKKHLTENSNEVEIPLEIDDNVVINPSTSLRQETEYYECVDIYTIFSQSQDY